MIIKRYDGCSILGLRPQKKCAAFLSHVEHATKYFDPEICIPLDYDCSSKITATGANDNWIIG